MRILATCLIAGTALAVLFAAFSQSADARYWQSLSDLYRKSNFQNTDAIVPEAISRCSQGNTGDRVSASDWMRQRDSR